MGSGLQRPMYREKEEVQQRPCATFPFVFHGNVCHGRITVLNGEEGPKGDCERQGQWAERPGEKEKGTAIRISRFQTAPAEIIFFRK